MRELLEFFLKYFDHLYQNPEYHITNSKTSGANAINASITVTGPEVSWLIANDRGQMQLSISPTRLQSPENWFWISLIRQYLDGQDEIQYLSATEELSWARDNDQRLAELFSDGSRIKTVCEELRVRRRSNAEKYWGQL
ncbi:hypothetical protein BCA37_20885 [Mycobacterium sp. djl-10]|nr:hypothetical protein BCA37_20885 [Mycobacterium sp. djl-10]